MTPPVHFSIAAAAFVAWLVFRFFSEDEIVFSDVGWGVICAPLWPLLALVLVYIAFLAASAGLFILAEKIFPLGWDTPIIRRK